MTCPSKETLSAKQSQHHWWSSSCQHHHLVLLRHARTNCQTSWAGDHDFQSWHSQTSILVQVSDSSISRDVRPPESIKLVPPHVPHAPYHMYILYRYCVTCATATTQHTPPRILATRENRYMSFMTHLACTFCFVPRHQATHKHNQSKAF